MTDRIELAVLERQKEATLKNIFGRANFTGKFLGKKRNWNEYSVKFDKLEIYRTEGILDEVNVFYGRKKVFSGRYANITAYIPGEWEEKLETAYQKALSAREVSKIESEKVHRGDLVKNFGI